MPPKRDEQRTPDQSALETEMAAGEDQALHDTGGEQPQAAPARPGVVPDSHWARSWLPPENIARLETHELRTKGEPRPNPTDFRISLRSKYGTDQQFLRPGVRRQSMRGFEDHYVDIVDFIVRATHRIWEEKDVGYIYDHYRHNARVIDDYGLAWGREVMQQIYRD